MSLYYEKTGINECAGYKTWTDYGWDFDCDYEYAGWFGCEDCIFGGNGGNKDPREKPDNYIDGEVKK